MSDVIIFLTLCNSRGRDGALRRGLGSASVMQSRLDQLSDATGLRRQTVEHVFDTLRACAGRAPFLTRTLEKIRTEMSLAVLAYNMKRMIQLFGINRCCTRSEPDDQKRRFHRTGVFTRPRSNTVDDYEARAVGAIRPFSSPRSVPVGFCQTDQSATTVRRISRSRISIAICNLPDAPTGRHELAGIFAVSDKSAVTCGKKSVTVVPRPTLLSTLMVPRACRTNPSA